jgi:hypothetical protein
VKNLPRTIIPHVRSSRSWPPISRHGTLTCAFDALGRLALVTGIRRLFLPHVGMRGSVKHLFEEFQNSLWDRQGMTGKPELQREVLCELLSEESCAEWLGFNDLARPDTTPPLRRLAGLVREPDWTGAENIHKLRMYRTAAFIDCLRPNVLDWETPRIPDMEWVLEFIEVFTRPGISAEEQTDLNRRPRKTSSSVGEDCSNHTRAALRTFGKRPALRLGNRGLVP